MTPTKIAVVDDDPEWGELMLRILKAGGYDAVHFPTAGRFFDWMIRSRPVLVMLDMQLPGMHGREVIRVLRSNSETRDLLLVAVSSREVTSSEAVKAFEAGADEYLTKGVDPGLIMARLGALMRRGRATGASEERLTSGGLVILPEQRVVRMGGKEVALTHLEFDLLVYFVRQAGRVLTRSLILESVWGGSPNMDTRTVDKHVESLRRKLGPFGKGLETVIRVGYVLKAPGAPGVD